MPTATTPDGTRLHYSDRGSGRPVVFVHGTFMSGQIWAHQRPAFDSYRTLTVDLRGHGASTPADDYSLDAYASDVEAVLDDAGIRQATLVGWSNGSKTSARFAARNPDRVDACCLVSSNLFHKAASDAVREDDSRDHIDYDAFLADLRTDWPGTVTEFVDTLLVPEAGAPTREWVRDIAMSFPLHAALGHYRDVWRVTDAAHRDDLAGVADSDIPALVCHGVRDSSATPAEARAVADRLDARFVPFEDSAHFPFVTEVEAFNETLHSFLDATDGRHL